MKKCECCDKILKTDDCVLCDECCYISKAYYNGWVKDWPTKAGRYWLYASLYGDDKKVFLVEVREISNGVMCIVDGAFLFKSEIDDFFFKKAFLPIAPNIK